MAGRAKRLTESDVNSRLSVPREWWDVIRLLFREEDHRGEVELRVLDGVGMFWEFRCAVRQKGRFKKPVLQSDGWLQFVRYKGLRAGDVKSRLSVPRDFWDVIRLLFREEDHRGEVELRVLDGVGMFWEFRCAVRQKGRFKKPVLQSDGWLQFVRYKGLRAGDVIVLEIAENEFRGTMFKLRALKYDAVGDYWFDV